ncbi:MAG: FkbM family methyltransferase [Thermoplasmataceae archaeon]
MKFPGKQCAGEPQALFEVEGAGVIQPFTLHEGALCNDRVLLYCKAKNISYTYYSNAMFIKFGRWKIEFNSSWDVVGIIETMIADVYSSHLIQPGYTVLDIGAGIGDFTLLASKMVRKDGLVVAIEPNPADYSNLLKNIEHNHCTNVMPINVGLSDEDTETTISFKDQKFKAVVVTLTNLLRKWNLERFDFVKMDIEGSESKIVPSSINIFSKANVIAMELHGNQEELIRLLTDKGFKSMPVTKDTMNKNLRTFALSHPVELFKIYRNISQLEGYKLFQLLRRYKSGFTNIEGNGLSIIVFLSSVSPLKW